MMDKRMAAPMVAQTDDQAVRIMAFLRPSISRTLAQPPPRAPPLSEAMAREK